MIPTVAGALVIPEFDVTLGLGSNLGDREAQLRRAIDLLEVREIAVPHAVSAIFAGPALGPPQPDYLNQVVVARTRLEPLSLLAALKRLECELGRTPTERWGPRVIDLDILDFDGRELSLPGLELPHPGVAEREFVLVPWNELAPQRQVPGTARTVAELLSVLQSRRLDGSGSPASAGVAP
ncbi:MAG: 2-amino-4-hydroxy-6-hydroxymethyldihydropteridine diphosphokinase [Planctomycetota bacterium]